MIAKLMGVSATADNKLRFASLTKTLTGFAYPQNVRRNGLLEINVEIFRDLQGYGNISVKSLLFNAKCYRHRLIGYISGGGDHSNLYNYEMNS